MNINISNNRRLIIIVITGYLIYGLFFIWNTSYEINGQRYFSLLDDAMISMRYAENLADGNGPYFNNSMERVEGYTNPLWMLTMSSVHLTSIPKHYASLIMQIFALLLLTINLVFVYKLSFLLLKNNLYAVFGMTAVGLFLPLNVWGLGGMETSALTLIVTASVYVLYKSIEEQKNNIWIILLPAVGTLVRPDMILLLLTFYFISISFINRKDKKFEQNFGILLFAVIFLALSFRLYFYDDILPNTYYLKMTGYPLLLRITNGIASIISMTPVLIIWYISLYFFKKRGQISKYMPMSIIVLVVIFYNIYIGGDAWDWWHGSNRFLTVVIPLIIIMGLDFILYSKIKYKREDKKYLNLQAAFFTGLLILFLNAFNGIDSLAETFLFEKPILMKDNQKLSEIALAAKKAFPDKVQIGGATAGVLPYFSELEFVDFLGKNDKTISRLDGRIEQGIKQFWSFSPGHNKWDYSYSIGKIRPDVVVQLWSHHEEALPYLSRAYKLEKFGDYHFFIKIQKD